MFGINNASDISKLLYVISRAVRRVKFETILKYHEWYLWQISSTNHAIICLYYYPQQVVIFTCRYFKLSWNTTALSQSNCRNFSCSSINCKILVTRDTITNGSIGWLRTRHNRQVWIKYSFCKSEKEDLLLYSLTINGN